MISRSKFMVPGIARNGFVRTLATGVVIAAMSASYNHPSAYAGGVSAVHLVNDSHQDAVKVLNGGGTFVTDFKGTNDVSISLLAGTLQGYEDGTFGGPKPGNNPGYLQTYLGSPATGTGSGALGDLLELETKAPAVGVAPTSIQFDFSKPLTSLDSILIQDVDTSEQYQILAYQKTAGGYVQVSELGWTHVPLTGQTGILPNSSWPIWDPSNGTLTANTSGGLPDNLDMLIADQPIDRIIFRSTRTTQGFTAQIQFITPLSNSAVPEPTSLVLTACGGAVLLTVTRRRNSGR